MGGRAQLGPLSMSATNWPIVPAPGGYEDGDFGGMIIGRGNRRTRTKTCPSATLSTTNPTWPDGAQTQAAAVRSHRLTTWPMARLRQRDFSLTDQFYFTIKIYNANCFFSVLPDKMWEPGHLATLWAFTACYRDSFTAIFTWMEDTHTTGMWKKIKISE
jgi:hypothetical protein